MPDRHADAVRRRRAELRTQRVLLTSGHRGEIRTACALTRIALVSEVAATVAELARLVTEHVEYSDRADRGRLPVLLADAAGRAHRDVLERVSAVVLPALRRVATVRGLPAEVVGAPGAGLPAAPFGDDGPVLPRPGPAPGPWRSLASAGSGSTWRLVALPVAGIPVVGLPALAGPQGLAPAVALCGLLLGGGAAQRWVAADRARWRQWIPPAAAAVRAVLDSALLSALLDHEQRAGAAVDAAVAVRLAEVDAELRVLTPSRGAVGGGAEDVDALG